MQEEGPTPIFHGGNNSSLLTHTRELVVCLNEQHKRCKYEVGLAIICN